MPSIIARLPVKCLPARQTPGNGRYRCPGRRFPRECRLARLGRRGQNQSHAMRFLCDAMLGGLVRWLRAAGYDSLLAEGSWRDRELVDLCAREQRILLTQDRELGIIAPAVVPVLLLAARDLDHNARELREVLGVDWQHAPFTRRA